MKSRMLISLALASLSLIFAAGCSSSVSKKKSFEAADNENQEQVLSVVGTHYTTLFFNVGRSNLSENDKENLKELSTRAHRTKKSIYEIRVLAWADKEYPEEVNSMVKMQDVKLASDRAKKIKRYLKENLNKYENIETFNMAKRPHLISKLIKNDDYDVKSTFESSGATGSTLPDGKISYTKSSKALVIINYLDDKNI